MVERQIDDDDDDSLLMMDGKLFLFCFSWSLIFPSKISFPSLRKLKDEITSKLAICQTKAKRILGMVLEASDLFIGSYDEWLQQADYKVPCPMFFSSGIQLNLVISHFILWERNGLKPSTLGNSMD